MSAMEKSDLPEVARKRANKAVSTAAEPVERRGGTKVECGPAKHGPDSESGSRVTGAGPHTRSRHQAAFRERRDRPLDVVLERLGALHDGRLQLHLHRRR